MQAVAHLQHAPSANPSAHPPARVPSRVDNASCLGYFAWARVRQWRRKRMLMRPEAAFPYVFAAEGAQHPPKKPPRSTTLAAAPAQKAATLNDPRRSTRLKSRHAQRPSPRSTRSKSRHAQRPSPQHPPRPPPTHLTPHHRKKADCQSFDLKSASALCFDRHPISRGISPWSVSASLSSRQRRH